MTKKKEDARLHWIRFNPSEWLGICAGLDDAEIGMFHRIVEKLWSTPGNTMRREDLMQRLRIKAGSEAETRFIGLIGCVSFVDSQDCIFIPQVNEAFASVVSRSDAARNAAKARWPEKQEKPKDEPQESNASITADEWDF